MTRSHASRMASDTSVMTMASPFADSRASAMSESVVDLPSAERKNMSPS
ncbi:MAG: hypothetical protein U5K74_12480 [Gemmatimonadaceae bacterium]|nr:hypothetical protein [Gemmatimonadaceae bacterium]